MPRAAVPPPPPGWYDDPYERGLLRYHDGTRWTEHTAGGRTPTPLSAASPASAAPVPVEPLAPHLVGDRVAAAEAPIEQLPVAPSRRRPIWLRVALVCCGALVFLAVNRLAAGPARAESLLAVPVVLALLVFVAVTAPRVSYRRVDAAFALIPLYLPYVLCRICWRLAYLPYRDWEPRADEAAGWQAVRDPDRPDRVLYLTHEGYARLRGAP